MENGKDSITRTLKDPSTPTQSDRIAAGSSFPASLPEDSLNQAQSSDTDSDSEGWISLIVAQYEECGLLRREGSHQQLVREPFVYERLKDDEMRVFQLLPCGSWDAPLLGELHTVKIPTELSSEAHARNPVLRRSLDRTLTYEALSYAWGPTYSDGSHLTSSIVCDGRELKVTSNLHQALERLCDGNYRMRRVYHFQRAEVDEFITLGRDHSVDLTARQGSLPGHDQECARKAGLPLWIDAVCINQSDWTERSQQVAKMHRILEHAYSITIWLGEPDEGPLGYFYDQLLLNGSIQDERAVVETFLALPWFCRRWVIQEVASRGNCYAMRLGNQERPYGQIYDLVGKHYLNTHAGPMELRTKPLTLLQALFIYRDCECLHPLDRIYALRNIASDGFRVSVDYSRSVREVYTDLALASSFGSTNYSRQAQTSSEGVVRETTPLSSPSFEKLGQLHLRLSDTRPVEMLRMLVLPTCFKTPPQASAADLLDGWVPDWRVKATFESHRHEETADLCVTQDCHFDNATSHLDLPDRLLGTDNGRLYLHVPGSTVLCIPSADHSGRFFVRSAQDGSLRFQADWIPPITGKALVWFPWLGPSSRSSL